MKTFKQLKEETEDTIVIVFGRFQGIHKGHAELINATMEEAKRRNADHLIFPSVSQDSKKNPIPFDQKVDFLQRVFPKANFNDNPEYKQIFKILPYVSKGLGYENVVFLAGDDRVEEWEGKLDKFLRGEGPLKNLEIESTGARSVGISGSDVRKYVKNDDFQSYLKIAPKGISEELARKIFDTMKENLK